MRLVTNWKALHRAYSVRTAALLAAMIGLKENVEQLATMPLVSSLPAVKAAVASPAYGYALGLLAVATVALRFVDQGLHALDDNAAETDAATGGKA